MVTRREQPSDAYWRYRGKYILTGDMWYLCMMLRFVKGGDASAT